MTPAHERHKETVHSNTTLSQIEHKTLKRCFRHRLPSWVGGTAQEEKNHNWAPLGPSHYGIPMPGFPRYGLHIPLPSSCLTLRNCVIAQDRNTHTQDPQDLGWGVCPLIILALGRLRQEDHKLYTSLCYKERQFQKETKG